MGFIEEMAGRGANRALQMLVDYKGGEKFDAGVEALDQTGIAMRSLAATLRDRTLTAEEIDVIVREAAKYMSAVQLESLKATLENIAASLAR